MAQERRDAYPQIHYPWPDVREALGALASVTPRDEAVQLAYVNPETGRPCLPTLGFLAQQLRAGQDLSPHRSSASGVIHVIEGEGDSLIDGVSPAWSEGDTVAVSTHSRVTHRARGKDAYLFHIDDAPMQRALGIYEDF